ncbi:aspartic peptidase domain-containing protein [Aspergillus pseudonomiae]|nr:aspartic peptidase domain-containing protein [Aspergillus pseudonomiae]
MILFYKCLILQVSLATWVLGSPNVVKMGFSRGTQRQSASNNGSFGVQLGNYIPAGLYYVNASIGTPAQVVQLQLDTGSSDVWAFGVHSCDLRTSYCLGGAYNPNQSSTATVIAEGAFQISYVTQGSGVEGNWVKDDFSVGNITIKGLDLGVATHAESENTGIMGIGFRSHESNNTLYPNFVDQMVAQGFTKSRSYSLWLDDLYMSTGSVLFGGYDSDKFHNELVALPMEPNATGVFTDFAVTWTSFSFTNASGTETSLSGQDFKEYTILDSGSTGVLIPDQIYQQIAQAFRVLDNGRVDCALKSANGTFNFGFGGPTGVVIAVPIYEFIIPGIFPNGTRMTDSRGIDVCWFGMEAQKDRPLLLGDTMLRSAYVVYNLDDKWIAMAPTNFNSTTSNITEIKPSSSLPAGWKSAPNITVSQTATGSISTGASTPVSVSGTLSSGVTTVATASLTGATGFTTAM